MSKLATIKRMTLASLKHIFLMGLIFAWVFSGWPLVQAEETATSTGVAVSIDATSTPTSTDQIIAEQPADEEKADEESVPGEAVPPQEPATLPKPPLKNRTIRKYFSIVQNAEHRCNAEIFRIDISGKVSAQARIRPGGKKVQSGELEIGSLPIGIDILFSDNGDYRHGILQNDGAFDLEIINQEGSQKGSFSIPIFYTDGESNYTTVCQINIINQ